VVRVRFDLSLFDGGRRRTLPRKRAAVLRANRNLIDAGAVSPVADRGWWPVIREAFTGAWQQNVVLDFDSVLSFYAVFACATRISNDFGKLAEKLYRWDPEDRIWLETDSPAFSPVLRKPNKYQTHVQYKEWYLMSKLLRGNVYVLKGRDERGVVVARYVLDPGRTKPLITPDGSVYYQLDADNLTNDLIPDTGMVVPASEIIHDRINCLYHPLVGVSPIFACGLAAMQGLAIQKNSTRFFGSMSRPAGILTAPGHIKKATAERLKETWETNYGGENYGRTAVLGDDLKYQPISVSASDAQMIEQFRLTPEIVCSAFGVPMFKIFGNPPAGSNAETLNQIYYSDCLQSHIEQYEAVTDEGLGIGLGNPKDGTTYGVGLDEEALLRMDSKTQTEVLKEQVTGALRTPDEARQKLDLPSVVGGDQPYLQQQNWSLEALARRDKQAAPAPTPGTLPQGGPPAALPAPGDEDDPEAEPDGEDEDMAERTLAALKRELAA
jgi:HK97 family phage portal protein